jgi:hypothetical protein
VRIIQNANALIPFNANSGLRLALLGCCAFFLLVAPPRAAAINYGATPPKQTKGVTTPPPSTALSEAIIYSPQTDEFKVYGVSLNMVWYALGVGLLLAMAAFWFKDRRPARADAPQKIDPKKWFLDRETGEYHRLRFTDKEGVATDSENFGKRYAVYLTYKIHLRNRRRLLLALYAATTALVYFTAHAWKTTEGLSLTLLVFAPLTCVVSGVFVVVVFIWLGLELSLLNARERDVGPRPIAPRGREEVEEQKAYGDAGAANIGDIHAALSGNAPADSRRRAAPTGPIYDE